MAAELDPVAVAARLNALRALYVAETLDEGRARLLRGTPPLSVDAVAARGLVELRALCELASHLRGTVGKPVSRSTE